MKRYAMLIPEDEAVVVGMRARKTARFADVARRTSHVRRWLARAEKDDDVVLQQARTVAGWWWWWWYCCMVWKIIW